jgi:hypothetical protein
MVIVALIDMALLRAVLLILVKMGHDGMGGKCCQVLYLVQFTGTQNGN